jgi:ribulose-phosphate 3-epimerase
MPQIIPSIFVPDEQMFFNQVRMIDGVVDMFQLDIADGNFVSATTWASPEKVAQINPNLKIELHLMTEHPIAEMKRWKDVRQVSRVLFHYESLDDTELCIETCMHYGWQPSMVLNPGTEVCVIEPYTDHLFGVMIMGVHPGAQGQSYIYETTERLQYMHTHFPHLFLEVDGGVTMETIADILTSKLDAVCPGSAIFASGTARDNIATMRKVIHTWQEQQDDVL